MMASRVINFRLLLILALLAANQVLAKSQQQSASVAEAITIQVFSDFQCPFCAQFAPAIRELQKMGVEGVATTVEFKQFPLNFHPDALLAARAALAAREQGRFWEMHDLLFARQAALKRGDLLRHAQKLKLDLNRFRKDLDSERIKRIMEADIGEGENLGVSGTPTFFLNGQRYIGARSFDQLKQLVQDELRRMRAISEISDKLLSYGPPDALVTVEFFADLQSPITRQALDVLDQVSHKYPSKVRIQFRNFPLAFHPQALLAHEAAMTAASQGHFWEFARYVLDHQDTLREQELVAYAVRLGLDDVKFSEMMLQHRYAPRVEVDLIAGLRRGIRGSPVIFVNDKRIDGVPSLEVLINQIEAAVASPLVKQQ